MGNRLRQPNEPLRQARIHRRWTQEDVATELRRVEAELGGNAGFIRADKNHVSKWERGIAAPSPFYAIRLCLIFDCEPQDLGLPSSPGIRNGCRRLRAKLIPAVSPLHAAAAHSSLSTRQIPQESEPVKRREFLALGSWAGVTLVDPSFVMRMHRVLNGGLTADDETLAFLEKLTEHYASELWTVPSGSLIPIVTAHLWRLRALLRHSQPAGRAARLGSLASKTALIAGHLSSYLCNRGDAIRYSREAEGLAAEWGHTALQAKAIVDRSYYYSRAPHENVGGDSETVLTMLAQAEKLAAGHPSILARIYAHRAEELALTSRATAAYRSMERAEKALATRSGSPPDQLTGWSPARLVRYHGACAIHSGRGDRACRLYESAVQDASVPLYEAAARVDAAVAYARHGDLDQACDHLSRALAIAATSQFHDRLQAIMSVRHSALRSWQGDYRLGQLDERLRSFAS